MNDFTVTGFTNTLRFLVLLGAFWALIFVFLLENQAVGSKLADIAFKAAYQTGSSATERFTLTLVKVMVPTPEFRFSKANQAAKDQ